MIYSLHTDYTKPHPNSFYMVTAGYEKEDGPRRLFPEDINFKPGLNIVVGGNGSGKSTLLRALWTSSLQSCISDEEEFGNGMFDALKGLNDVFTDIYSMDHGKSKAYEFFNIKMDFNSPVYMLNEISSFSGDKALANRTNIAYHLQNMHSSKGEKLLLSIFRFARGIADSREERKTYSSEVLLDKLNSYGRVPDSVIKGYIENHQYSEGKPQPTIILDEVDSGLDVFGLENVKEWLLNASKGFQVIVALHNVTLIKSLEDSAHIIEMTDSYMDYLNAFQNGHEISIVRPVNARDKDLEK